MLLPRKQRHPVCKGWTARRKTEEKRNKRKCVGDRSDKTQVHVTRYPSIFSFLSLAKWPSEKTQRALIRLATGIQWVEKWDNLLTLHMSAHMTAVLIQGVCFASPGSSFKLTEKCSVWKQMYLIKSNTNLYFTTYRCQLEEGWNCARPCTNRSYMNRALRLQNLPSWEEEVRSEQGGVFIHLVSASKTVNYQSYALIVLWFFDTVAVSVMCTYPLKTKALPCWYYYNSFFFFFYL